MPILLAAPSPAPASSHRLVMTLWPVSAAKVSGWTNLRGRLGHHHVHFERLALQCAHQFRRLVRGNSAGDADRDSHGSIVEFSGQ